MSGVPVLLGHLILEEEGGKCPVTPSGSGSGFSDATEEIHKFNLDNKEIEIPRIKH